MNLKTMFGRQYVVTLEESCVVETPENQAEARDDEEDWAYQEIKGKCGTVYPYSEAQIAVVLPTRAAHRLMKLMGPELVLLQHADDEMCFKADAQYSEALVQFIKAKSRRQLTPAHKAVLAARLARYRFQRPKPAQTEPGWVGSGATSARVE
jgi:hypothetical protein